MKNQHPYQDDSQLENTIQGIRKFCLVVMVIGIGVLPVAFNHEYPGELDQMASNILGDEELEKPFFEPDCSEKISVTSPSKGQITFCVEDILLCEYRGGSTIIYEYNSDYRGDVIRESLPEVKSLLGYRTCFFQVNQSQYANLNMAIEFDKESYVLHLDDGFECDVPRRNVNDLEQNLAACTY